MAAFTVPAIAYGDAITVFSTGVDSAGNLLPAGAIDPHWTAETETYDRNQTITSSGPQNFLVDYNAANYVGSAAYRPDPAAGGFNGYGLDTPHAGTIAWSAANQGGNVAYTYRTTFDLSGLNPATASITLTYAADDDGELALNGALIPSTYNFRTGARTYTLSSGFVDGLNTLDLVSYNEGGAGVAFVQIDSATASVPEPAAFGIFGIGAAGLLAVGRRRAIRAA